MKKLLIAMVLLTTLPLSAQVAVYPQGNEIKAKAVGQDGTIKFYDRDPAAVSAKEVSGTAFNAAAFAKKPCQAMTMVTLQVNFIVYYTVDCLKQQLDFYSDKALKQKLFTCHYANKKFTEVKAARAPEPKATAIGVFVKDGKVEKTGNSMASIKFYDKGQQAVANEIAGAEILATAFDDPCTTKKMQAKLTDGTFINYILDCDHKKINFFKDDQYQVLAFAFTLENNLFVLEKSDGDTGTATKGLKAMNQIPFPKFKASANDNGLNRSSNRYLFVDAHPNHNKKINNSLFKADDNEGSGKTDTLTASFKAATALPVNSSLTVFVRAYNFHKLENLTVTIDGIDYDYNKDLGDVYASVKTPSDSGSDGTSASDKALDKDKTPITNTDYFKAVLEYFETLTYMNINDVYVLEGFKSQLRTAYEADKGLLTAAELQQLSEILNWFPEYISITPFSLTVPDTDEVDITVSVKNIGVTDAKTYKVGTFRTSGGLSFGLGSMLYATGLKNREAYTTTIKSTSADAEDQVYAHLDDSKDMSLGIGLNTEMAFRTGYLVNPTLNVGFFIPFDEEISPFVAIGPGISISSKKVHFSISGGLAFGKVNTIKQQYDKVDLNTLGETLTSTDLTEKSWDTSYYFAVGVRFNVLESGKKGQN